MRTAEMPTMETCNGIDDDCDGRVDEQTPFAPPERRAPGDPCTLQAGGCVSRGVLRCGPRGEAICDAPPPVASEEVCDGIDNDCDGAVDENPASLAPTPCTVGRGACARTGMYRCTGPTARTCDATPGASDREVCDGIDNDCDGIVDYVGSDRVACVVVHPWCERHGTWTCTPAGRLCAWDSVTRTDHFDYEDSCNGRDDDCNGLVDEYGERLPDGSWRPCPRMSR